MNTIWKRVGSNEKFTGVWRYVAVITGLMLTGTVAQAAVLGSRHDLGGAGQAQQTTTATTEVCVFCHTPHGAQTNASVPLWNKRLQQPAGGYTRYSTLNTSTLDGTEAPVGSVSLACLACHDGTQAMDVVINAPGRGGYNAAGAELDAAGISAMTGAPIPMLGSDLANDHPISIQYGGGGCTDANPGCTLRDGDFQIPANAVINNVRQWWINTTGGTANRERADIILYTRTDVNGQVGTVQPSVECGSCHDPHNEVAQPVQFMRISNANSAVCLACHIK